MNDTAPIWSSQLRIVTGRAVEDVPQIGFSERVDPRGRLIQLFLLAEPVADGADAFADLFVRRVASLFDPGSHSLTGAIQAAIETAHLDLRNWNRQRVASEHAMYGLSCLIHRNDQPALLCQVGPSLAILAGDPGAAGSRPTLTYTQQPGQTPSQDLAAPIGGSAPLVYEFASAPQSTDGWALLLSPNTEPLFNAERRVQLSRLPAQETLPMLYPVMLELRDAAAIVIGRAPPDPPSQPEREQEPQPDDIQLHPAPDPPIEHPPDSQQQTSRASAAPEPQAPTGGIGSPAASPLIQTVHFDPIPLSETEIVWPANPFVLPAAQRVDSLATAATPTTRPSLNRPLMELKQALPSLKPPTQRPSLPAPRVRTGRPMRDATWPRVGLSLIVMLLILIGVGFALLGPSLLRSDDDQLRLHIDRAQTGLAAARLATDTQSARLALSEALNEVNAALLINPLAPDGLQLRSDIEAVIAELTRVLAPGALETLVDLSGFGPTIALGALRGGDQQLFALDHAGGRVFAIDRNGAARVIFLEGELLGIDNQSRATQPISIAYQQARAGDQATLWILDAQSRLYQWTASGVLLMPIPDLDRLGSVDAVAASSANLYLLDRAGGAIWAFKIGPTALDRPARVVGRTDLHSASEFVAAQSEGGAVQFVVATSDGRVQRFLGNTEQPIDLQLERDLLAPASLSLGANSELIYLVDRGHDRVLAIHPNGAVSSQIQSADLSELRGVWVSEAAGQIIYALPDSLLIGRLPSGQQ